jgi:hypothetical protein
VSRKLVKDFAHFLVEYQQEWGDLIDACELINCFDEIWKAYLKYKKQIKQSSSKEIEEEYNRALKEFMNV